ncbi:hypothetical protein HNV12_02810 [Methanococcoides sp. SA1]|nr:hypothetical protein [Methanococcoides sp. SA1]
MEALWRLPKIIGPGYREVVKQYPDTYILNQRGDVLDKETKTKLAHKPSYGRPISSTSLTIEHEIGDPEKLALTLALSKTFEENNCSDFTENPSRKTLELIAKKRF